MESILTGELLFNIFVEYCCITLTLIVAKWCVKNFLRDQALDRHFITKAFVNVIDFLDSVDMKTSMAIKHFCKSMATFIFGNASQDETRGQLQTNDTTTGPNLEDNSEMGSLGENSGAFFNVETNGIVAIYQEDSEIDNEQIIGASAQLQNDSSVSGQRPRIEDSTNSTVASPLPEDVSVGLLRSGKTYSRRPVEKARRSASLNPRSAEPKTRESATSPRKTASPQTPSPKDWYGDGLRERREIPETIQRFARPSACFQGSNLPEPLILQKTRRYRDGST